MPEHDQPELAVLEVGALYVVAMKDCCVEGAFTARLTHKEIDDGSVNAEDEGFISSLTFDNGVTLTETMGCTFYRDPKSGVITASDWESVKAWHDALPENGCFANQNGRLCCVDRLIPGGAA